jgi:hypothetical protein
LPVDVAISRPGRASHGKILDHAGLGLLTRFLPPDAVDEVLAGWRPTHGKKPRTRALPARFGVYFVLALCLFSHLSSVDVAGRMVAGPAGWLRAAAWRAPSSTALSKLRARLGSAVFAQLLQRVASPLTTGRASWSHLGDLLLVAWDGTSIATTASPANRAAFNPPGAPQGVAGAHYPNLTLLTLIACGTRALLGAAMDSFGDEHRLAHRLLDRLGPGMLLLADRNFYGHHLWQQAGTTGAELLWRIKGGVHLPIVKALPDGSYLTALVSRYERKKKDTRDRARRRIQVKNPRPDPPMKATLARVIVCMITITLDDGTTRTEPYQLLTTLLDHHTYPAQTLAAAYAERWSCETSLAELKTRLRGSHRLLRAQHPDTVRQETYAYLIVYQAIRWVIVHAAAGRLDPDRISFTRTLNAIRAAYGQSVTTLDDIEATILDPRHLNPDRPGRIYPRAIWKVFASYDSRRQHTTPIARNATYTIAIPRPVLRPRHPIPPAQTAPEPAGSRT